MKEELIRFPAKDRHISARTILDASDRIRPVIERTRIITNTFLNELWDCEVYVKCEQEQPIGAFKLRGASNFALQLESVESKSGIVTHSSGNHAQAVAYMAHQLNIPSHVIMPKNANKRKVEAAKKWGAQITFCEPTIESRIETADAVVKKTGGVLIPPFDHEWIVAGQATCALEILEDQPEMEMIFAPLGGGGLLAGSALSAKYFSSNTTVIGTEPEQAQDGFQGLSTGKKVESFVPNTIADGLRTPVGQIPFDILKNLVSDVWLTSEKEIIDWMYRIWTELKLVIEPTSAVPFAAINSQKEKVKGKKIAIIITGGNVDFTQLPGPNET